MVTSPPYPTVSIIFHEAVASFVKGEKTLFVVTGVSGQTGRVTLAKVDPWHTSQKITPMVRQSARGGMRPLALRGDG